jgi:GcrA cell cycle regulator
MTEPWTADTIATLTKLWSDGKTASAIGAILGFSKNSVLGKAHRLGLSTRTGVVRKPPYKPPYKPRTAKAAVTAPKPPTPLAELVDFKVSRPKPGRPCGIVDCTGCKWPVGWNGNTTGRHLFCNKPQLSGKSYCEEHASC